MKDYTYKELELLNATIIGFMMGIYSVMGKGGAQAVANMAGQYVGREILRFAQEHGRQIKTIDDFIAFAVENGLAGEITYSREGDTFHLFIPQCYICPKKVGHYRFDGTACPWGGILAGVLGQITESRFSAAVRLIPGEVCEITVKKA